MAKGLGPSQDHPMSIFQYDRRLARAQPILVRLFGSIGIAGTDPFEVAGLFSNAHSRLEQASSFKDSVGRDRVLQCILYAGALALDEAQRHYRMMLSTPVSVAVRPASFFNADQSAHRAFNLATKIDLYRASDNQGCL